MLRSLSQRLQEWYMYHTLCTVARASSHDTKWSHNVHRKRNPPDVEFLLATEQVKLRLCECLVE